MLPAATTGDAVTWPSNFTPGAPQTGARSRSRSRKWACPTPSIRSISRRVSSSTPTSSRSVPTTAYRRSSIPDGPGGKPISVFESGAILIYLGEKTGKFWPKGDLRAQVPVLEWLMWQMGGFGPMPGQVHHFLMVKDEADRKYGLERYMKETHRLYGVFNKRLGDAKYAAGDAVSIADFAILGWAWRHERHQVSLSDYPNVKRWYDELMARPATKRGIEISLGN